MEIAPFEIRPPSADEVPILVSIPHTGIYVPEVIAADFASDHIRGLPMTDWHLHELYDFLPALGITTLYATYSRFVADLNRPPDDKPLYPGRFETGFVATETFWGEPIYRTPPHADEIARRGEWVHKPYHAMLLQLIQAKVKRFGEMVLIDAHSVASRANKLHGELKDDIYLGDRDGHSNSGWLTTHVEDSFKRCGLRVLRNNPYKGGYITDHYGKLPDVEALQVEMVWRLYMDESDALHGNRHPKFPRFKDTLQRVFSDLAEAVRLRAKAAK